MLIFVVVIVLGRKISGRSLQGGRPFFGLKFDSLAWFYFQEIRESSLVKPPALPKCGRFFIAPLKIYLLIFNALRKNLKKFAKKLG